MFHRMTRSFQLWKPGTAVPGNRLGCCFISFRFLWAILCPRAVVNVLPQHDYGIDDTLYCEQVI